MAALHGPKVERTVPPRYSAQGTLREIFGWGYEQPEALLYDFVILQQPQALKIGTPSTDQFADRLSKGFGL
jgi:hypothetical protein